MAQAVTEEGLEGARKQEKRDSPKTLSPKSESPKNSFLKADLLKAESSRKGDPPDIFKEELENKISQKKTDSALETNKVLYQKVCLLSIMSILSICKKPMRRVKGYSTNGKGPLHAVWHH